MATVKLVLKYDDARVRVELQEASQASTAPAANGNNGGGLKRLHFVVSKGSAAVEAAESLYRWLRTRAVPSVVMPELDLLERTFTGLLQPWTKPSCQALHTLDDTLDLLLTPARLQQQLSSPDAWKHLAGHPQVAALLQAVQPATDLGARAISSVHDHVVPSPYYKAAVDLGVNTFGFAQSAAPFKLAVRLLSPVVQPLMPWAEAAGKNEAIAATIDYWRPKST